MNRLEENTNILIVDDTIEHIKTASTILKPLGYKIRIATSGKTALRLIEECIPTLILLDIKMNDLSGYDVCKAIKNNPRYQDIAIIFMTALDDEESIRKSFSLGAQDYVIKPYNASELIARTTTHIKLANQAIALKRSYHELDQFCHSVSHDLKSPLQVVQQLCGMLRDTLGSDCTEDTLEILNQLDKKSNHMIEMIESLLLLSKSAQADCNLTPLLLQPLVEGTLKELLSLVPERKITVKIDALPSVEGDEALLKLLFQNVLQNAIKFTSKTPEAMIHITSVETDASFEIKVMDNGSGFDMTYASKLFHVFERLHSEDEFPGTGVGLAIVERIMKRHNGTVRICGEPDRGAAVTLCFPKGAVMGS